MAPPLVFELDAVYTFLNFLLKPTSPIKPELKSQIAPGMGTGSVSITKVAEKRSPGFVLVIGTSSWIESTLKDVANDP